MASRGPNIPISEFDGSRTVEFVPWLNDFERKFAANNWPADRKAVTLAGYLKGHAKITYNALGDDVKADYDELVKQLKERLRTTDRERFTRQRFETLHQKPGQSVSDYSVQVCELAETALGFITNASQRGLALRERFMAGLLPHIREQLNIMGPATYEEALIAAERVESARLGENATSKAESKSEEEKLNEALQNLIGEVAALKSKVLTDPTKQKIQATVAAVATPEEYESAPTWAKPLLMALDNSRPPQRFKPARAVAREPGFTQPSQKFTTSGRALCYNCGKPGHRARDCRSKFCTLHQTATHSDRECRAQARPGQDAWSQQRPTGPSAVGMPGTAPFGNQLAGTRQHGLNQRMPFHSGNPNSRIPTAMAVGSQFYNAIEAPPAVSNWGANGGTYPAPTTTGFDPAQSAGAPAALPLEWTPFVGSLAQEASTTVTKPPQTEEVSQQDQGNSETQCNKEKQPAEDLPYIGSLTCDSDPELDPWRMSPILGDLAPYKLWEAEPLRKRELKNQVAAGQDDAGQESECESLTSVTKPANKEEADAEQCHTQDTDDSSSDHEDLLTVSEAIEDTIEDIEVQSILLSQPLASRSPIATDATKDTIMDCDSRPESEQSSGHAENQLNEDNDNSFQCANNGQNKCATPESTGVNKSTADTGTNSSVEADASQCPHIPINGALATPSEQHAETPASTHLLDGTESDMDIGSAQKEVCEQQATPQNDSTWRLIPFGRADIPLQELPEPPSSKERVATWIFQASPDQGLQGASPGRLLYSPHTPSPLPTLATPIEIPLKKQKMEAVAERACNTSRSRSGIDYQTPANGRLDVTENRTEAAQVEQLNPQGEPTAPAYTGFFAALPEDQRHPGKREIATMGIPLDTEEGEVADEGQQTETEAVMPGPTEKRKGHRGGRKYKRKCKERAQKFQPRGKRSAPGLVPPLWGLMVLSVLVPTTTGLQFPNPLICQTAQQGQLWQFTDQIQCKAPATAEETPVMSTSLMLYKRNLLQYKTKAWLCRKVKQVVQTFTYFFDNEHLKKTSEEHLVVNGAECEEMIKYRKCSAGSLATQGSIFATRNNLDWRYTGGGWSCCRWKKFETTNCYLQEAFVYKRHRSSVMESSVGNVEQCVYEKGHCSLADKSFLIWKVNTTEKCNYLQWQQIKGTSQGNAWLCEDGTLALTFTDQQQDRDCQGNDIRFSDQGIPYRIIRQQEHQDGRLPTTAQLQRIRTTNRVNRQRRGVKESPGVVTSELLASSLQAVEVSNRKAVNFAFKHAFAGTCAAMNDVVNNLQALILSNPTLALRQALRQPNTFAIAGGKSIEVWPCLELPANAFSFSPMNSSCSMKIPITYRWLNRTRRGYLDTGTNIIGHVEPPEVDCSLVHRLPLTLQNKTYVYDPSTGELKIPEKPLILRPVHLNQSSWEVPSVIFHPVVMYHLEEFSQHISMNEILGGLTKQQEILNLLGMQLDQRSARDTASQTAANIVNRGMFGFLWGIAIDVKQVWVFACCCYVTVTVLVKVCWKYGCLRRIFKRLQNKVTRKISQAMNIYRNFANAPPTGIITTLDAQSKFNSRHAVVELAQLPRGLQRSKEYQPFRINCTYGADMEPNGSKLAVDVNGVKLCGLLDTGAQLSLIPRSSIERILAKNETSAQLTSKVIKAVSASGHILVLSGTIKAKVQVGKVALRGEFAIADDIPYELILGRDFIKELGPITLDLRHNAVKVGSEMLPLIAANSKVDNSLPAVNYIRVAETTNVPHSAECLIEGVGCLKPNTAYLVEALERHNGVKVATSLVRSQDDSVPIRLLNPANDNVKIHKNSRIAIATELSPEEEERVDRQLKAPCITTPERTENRPLDPVQLGAKFKDLDLTKSVLQGTDQEKLLRLLTDYSELFADGDHDLGQSNVVQHEINVGNATPVRSPPYRSAFSNRAVIKEKIAELLRNKIIQPSNSEWSSPIVLVKKKDGTWRMCVDYRKLNKVTKRDNYPMKRMDDVLASMGKAMIYSTLDLQSGYHQVEVRPNDMPKTAFISHEGLYEYLKMPFGLSNAPATFQRLMEKVLAGLDWKTCLVYLDDICIFAPTPELHLQRLRQVFQRLHVAGLKLKLKKCSFARDNVNFLGHVLTRDGLLPEAMKVSKVAAWPRPQNGKTLASFLGLCSYYRSFIPGFSKIASPLHAIAGKDRHFTWGTDCERAFQELKTRLTKAPVLVFPDFTKPFILQTDASDKSLGAVLSQVQEDEKDHPIAYASRLLNKAERNYATVEKEALGVVFAVDHFRPFIYGHEVLVVTDHKPLVWLFNVRNPDGKLMRWSLALQSYNLNIIHRKGVDNGNADALSRWPYELSKEDLAKKQQCSECNNLIAKVKQETQADECSIAAVHAMGTEDTFRKAQSKDDDLSAVYEQLYAGATAEADPKRLLPRVKEFCLEDGVLYRKDKTHAEQGSQKQLVVPTLYRDDVLRSCHDHLLAGHLGIRKTFHKVVKRFWWPTCLSDVKQWCNNCETCARRKPPGRKTKPPLMPIPVGRPWERIACDVLGGLPTTRRGNKYIIVMMDYFTKWPECVAVPDAKAERLAQVLVENVICRHGVPSELLTDQGPNMMSKVVLELCRLLDIKKLKTAPYHPACDGLVERFNRTLEAMLACYVNDGQTDWDDMLPYVLFAYRTSIQESTNESPFFLNYGRDPKLPVDLELRQTSENKNSTDDYKVDIAEKLTKAWQTAEKSMVAAQERQKAYHDRTAKDHAFMVGDRVLLYIPQIGKGKTMKLAKPWKGPYRILELSEDGTGAKVVACLKPGRQGQFRVNVRRLKRAPMQLGPPNLATGNDNVDDGANRDTSPGPGPDEGTEAEDVGPDDDAQHPLPDCNLADENISPSDSKMPPRSPRYNLRSRKQTPFIGMIRVGRNRGISRSCSQFDTSPAVAHGMASRRSSPSTIIEDATTCSNTATTLESTSQTPVKFRVRLRGQQPTDKKLSYEEWRKLPGTRPLYGPPVLIIEGPEHELSPDFQTRFQVGTQWFESAQQCFCYYLSLILGDATAAARMLTTTSARTLSSELMIARREAGPSQSLQAGEDTNATMMMANFNKFAKNPSLIRQLVATGDAVLVFGARDFRWGCEVKEKAAMKYDRLNYFGANEIGKILMHLRNQMHQRSWTQAQPAIATPMDAVYGLYRAEGGLDDQAATGRCCESKSALVAPGTYRVPLETNPEGPIITVKIGTHSVLALVDSGAGISVVQASWLRTNLGVLPQRSRQPTEARTVAPIPVTTLGTVSLQINISDAGYNQEFAIMDYEELFPVILGFDFLLQHQCQIDLAVPELTLRRLNNPD